MTTSKQNATTTYEIAGVPVKIVPQNARTAEFLQEYAQLQGNWDEELTVTDEQMQEEERLLPNPSEHLKEVGVLLRKMNALLLERYSGLVFHAAAMVFHGKAYLFAAPSGTGKTTHLRLWQTYRPGQAWVLNGDKPLIRFESDGIWVYGGPWRGKEGLGCNDRCKLGGIYLLRRGTQNAVRTASSQEALEGLLEASLYPHEASQRLQLIKLLQLLYSRVPVSVLQCTMGCEAVETVACHMEKGIM